MWQLLISLGPTWCHSALRCGPWNMLIVQEVTNRAQTPSVSSFCTPTRCAPLQYTSATYLTWLFNVQKKSCSRALCQRCHRVGVGRVVNWMNHTGPAVWMPPLAGPSRQRERGGNTDKRFSVLCLTLMMPVCPDECVCLCVCDRRSLQPDGVVCVCL